jgi:hypothetical protein
MMKILLLYFIPIAIIFIICYFDMNKGETIGEYIERNDVDHLVSILTFIPVVNIFMSIMVMFFFVVGIFFMIAEFIIDKIKNIRK